MFVTVCHQLESGHFAVVEVEVNWDCVHIPPVIRCDDGHEVALTDNDYEHIKLEAQQEYNYMRHF